MNSDNQAISQLQDLLSINIDSQKGFQEAADSTSDEQLKTFFSEFSQKRAHNAAELRSFISSAGEQPTNSGSMSATIHRWWIDAKQALTGKSPTAILDEAERGEDSIKKVYENTLSGLSDASARELVERQYRNVRDGHDQVKAMRNSYHRNPRG